MTVMCWNPWRELRADESVTLGFEQLPGTMIGYYDPHPELPVIMLNSQLGQAGRSCAVAHELIHHERGGGADMPGMPATWKAIVARDEQFCDDEAVRRLVPMNELVHLVVELEAGCEHPHPHHVAERFHVTETYGRRALELLDRHLDQVLHDRNALEDTA